jgi:multiple sugar transport system substrate-binding protein
LLVAVVVTGLACQRRESSASGAAQVTIRFWNGFTGPDGRTMLKLVKRFNQDNPDVHVIMQRMEWATYYNKLFVAGLGGRSPDVFVIHTDSLPRFQRAGFLRPMDDLFGPDGLDPNDFDPNVRDAVLYNGRRYAVPLDIHILGMYYNRELFRRAGIVDERGEPLPPRTRDEFLDDVKKLTDRTSKNPTWGFVFTWLRTNVYAIMCQYGGTFFNDDATATTIDSAANVAALQFCTDLIQKQHVAPAPQDFDSFIGFRQGKVGLLFEGIYMLPDLQRQEGLDWGAAPLPLLGEKPAAWCNSHNLCIRSDLSGPELDGAKRLVRFISDNTLDWAEGGQIPVRKSLRESKRFESMYAQREFAKQIPYATYMPRVLFVNEYLQEYETAIDSALRGSTTPQAALSNAARRISAVIQRYKGWQAPVDASARKSS